MKQNYFLLMNVKQHNILWVKIEINNSAIPDR